MKFNELKLSESILEAIGYMGFEEATEIQQKAIPLIIEGEDVLAFAQTGTGKTAAFILPTINKIEKSKVKGTKALVVCPTRELAIQIEKQIQGFTYFAGLDSIAVYGGGSGDEWEVQKEKLKNGVDIVVATPGKLISHLNMGFCKFKNLEFFILDEADRMMDMGFVDDIRKIASFLNKDRQTLLFSATMPDNIMTLSKELMKEDPKVISINLSKPAEGVLQAVYLANEEHKIPLIAKLIKDKPTYDSIIIFSGTKKKVSEIVNGLTRRGLNAHGISSDYDQSKREEVVAKFRSKKIRIIVATDVLSRGIDIKDINLVINYDVPKNAEDYVHRVGRTARASSTGVAITIINENDMYSFSKIEELIDTEIIKLALPEEIGVSPEWNPKKRNFSRGGGGKHKGKGGNKSRNKGRSGGYKKRS